MASVRPAAAAAPASHERVATEALTFDDVYEAHRGRVAGTVRHVLGPVPDAEMEDVLQKVFLEVYRALPSFQGRSKVTTWLYRLTSNVALQHLRKRRRKRWLVLGSSEDAAVTVERTSGTSPVSRIENRELLARVYQAAECLTDKKRIVWALHDLEGLDPSEIGAALGIPTNTARSRLGAARRELKAELVRLGVEPTLGRRGETERGGGGR